MKQTDIINRIEKIFDIEDPVVLRIRIKQLIDEILMGDEFPTSHPFYIDFIKLSFDALYPGSLQPVDLLKKSGFTKEKFEEAGFRKLVDVIGQADPSEAECILEMYGDPCRKRRKVSWGANLAQVMEIEKTVMDPEADYFSPNFSRSMDTPKQSSSLGTETRNDAVEHEKSAPEEAPVVNSVKKSEPSFDFRKIVEDGAKNTTEMNEILEDPGVIEAIFCRRKK